MALKEAQPKMSYLKMGIFGFSGAGKTRTATDCALGLHKHLKLPGDSPVAMYDTEDGSHYVIENFKKAGIKFMTEDSRSFNDLMAFIPAALKAGAQIVVIDSITHVWTNLQETYKKEKGVTRLYFQDWGPIKAKWQTFLNLFMSSPLHIFLCGRAGYEYENYENDEGKKELAKVGTKMKVEGDFSYEPSLLLEMSRIRPDDTISIKALGLQDQVKKIKTVNTKWLHVGEVLKDKTDSINGSNILYPKFTDFLLPLEKLNIGGTHRPIDETEQKPGVFERDESYSKKQKAEILLEEIESEIISICGASRSNEAQKAKIELMRNVFGTGSWTQVTILPLESLQNGLKILRDQRLQPSGEVQVPITKELKEAKAASSQ